MIQAAHHELVLARGALAALEAARLKSDDVELIKASFIAGPEPGVDAPDSVRADTFASIAKLRAGIAASQLAGVLEGLHADAIASATVWIRARS